MNTQLLRIILLGTLALAFLLVGNRAEARWYSPETAGFISRAPYPPAVEHPYSFGIQNPTGWFDATGREPMPANREEFCKNDPCKGKTVTSGKGNSFKGGEDCGDGNCFDWATSQSNNSPPPDSKPPGDNWHQEPGGEIIYYHGTWLGSGHGAIYDPASGCAASCSAGTWEGGPPGKKQVVVHHPACHPRGHPTSPWHDPWYWY